LGLVISSLVADPKTAANIVPLVLIPQIIMGGALIKYEDMNRNLGLVYSFSHWFSEHPDSEKTRKTESKLQVPLVCQFIAMRWSYEEMIVAQAKLNPLTKRQDRAQDEIQELAPKANTPQQRAHLNDLKDVLALLSGLEGRSAHAIDRYLKLVDPVIAGKQRFDRSKFKDAKGPVTADQLYVNQKVADLISRAEMERNGKRTLVLSDLEIDRGRRQADADEFVMFSELEREVQGKSKQAPPYEKVLAHFLKKRGVLSVAVPANFPLGYAEELAANNIRVRATDGLYWPEREAKSDKEIHMMGRA